MAGCFLSLEIDDFGIKASIVESGYKQNLVQDHCHVLFKDLPVSEENPVPFDAGMDMVARQLGLQTCSTATIFVSPLSICFRNLSLPFGSKNKIKQILPFELENLLPTVQEDYISDFHLLDTGKESNLILSASIGEAWIEKYFSKLNSFGIKPLIITPGGYATAMAFLRKNKNSSNFVFLHIADFESTIVLVNNGQPCTVRSFARSLYSSEDPDNSDHMKNLDNLETSIKQTIMGFNQRTGADILYDIFISSDGDNPDAERIYNALKRKDLPRLQQKIDTKGLLVNISPDKPGAYLFNFCQGAYGSSSFVKTYFSSIAACAVLCIISFSLFMISSGFDNAGLNKKIAAMDSRALSIFTATFPDKKKVHDPYLQMKANVRAELKKTNTSGDKDLSINKVKVVEIMGELSRKIPPSLDMETSRFLFNNGRLILSGSTDNFNNVDNIKSKIESSDLFENVSITSAAVDKKGNRVNFKFIIEM